MPTPHAESSPAAGPAPTRALFDDSLPLSAKQRLVLEAVRTYPNGATLSTLAADTGMHINTVRGHIDELLQRGAVRTSTSAARAGRGRPSLVVHARIPDSAAITGEQIELVNELAQLLAADDDTHAAHRRAVELGRRWARRVGHTAEHSHNHSDQLSALVSLMRRTGYDPDAPVDDPAEPHTRTISLNRCPFVSESARPDPLVCSIHHGFAQAAIGADEHSATTVTLLPFVRPGQCDIQLHCATTQQS
ncbi:hypothetical protein CCICO_04660 [Corynebacterium ciconiae DSM 44920]|uniref:helix-turn-helix transcriptional regulator n=1 Tax=Corynebacterium ciconiae TaxID=227319 RepID=UPI00035FE980|nr:helix-turn-helix domain-containing protein [Corynebacterium ciconiae]WKD60968.1 hypothetical protein CCICO_04660 [Corynebacterium ciconiae DSM 44920]